MKILFTHGYFLEEDPKEKEIMKPYPPLGILYLSAFLEKNNFDNQIFDSTFSTFNKWVNYMLDYNPDIIGIYTNLMTKLNVLKMVNFIKSHEVLKHRKIILGGPEVKNHAYNFLHNGADVIVIGEGEETMLELVQHFANPKDDLKIVNGIAFLQNEKLEETAERVKIKSVDELPFPNRKKINLQLYFDAWKKAHGESALSMSTQRGCPYTCKWCSRAVYGQSYRRRSAKCVADEIEQVQSQYKFDTVWFVDDVFTISHKWLKEFADEIAQRKIKVKYEIITRADRMNLDVIQLLKQSGCFRVWIGAESGSQKVIDAMDRRVDVNQVREMIKLTKAGGMQAGTFIMLGYPGETDDDIKETLHHLQDSNPDYYTVTVAYPIKGTPLYEETENIFVTQLSWETSTDRMIDFKRTYHRKYYDYAIRWIYNNMMMEKKNSSGNISKHYLKAIASRAMMNLYRLRSAV
jgi:anaerobic magnesium-protoporphyrin IX monomethyl ester cyclase